MMLTALACTCGTLDRASQGIQTAQAVATQAQGLATEIATTGALETLQSAATGVATSGALETMQSAATEVATIAGTQEGGSVEGVPDDIPIYPDHLNLQTFGGVISYVAHADLATVTQYYQTELPNNGWQQSQDPLLSAAASVLQYEKDDRKANLNLIDSQGTTVVAIQLQP